MKNIINEAVNLMREAGLTQRQRNLEQEARRLANEKYQVAVIGQFKTGKSTLINRVLLKTDLLFVDQLEATAVPTEIEYTPAPALLEIYPIVPEPGPAPGSAGEEKSAQFPINPMRVEGAPRRIENPTSDDIQRETSDKTPAGRAAKANQTARVRLLLPAENLKGITVIDTPGIDSTNQAVVATTYRVVPEADVTLYVTRAVGFSQIDRDFLSSRVFDAGISRSMVVVNYHPDFGRQSAPQLAGICAAIKADLAALGRPNIPVEMINLSDEAKAAEFDPVLQAFIWANALPGRTERCQAVVKRQLEQALVECEVELAALQKSPEEIKRIQGEIATKADEFEDAYRELTGQFLADLGEIQSEHFQAIAQGLDKISQSFLAGFDTCASLSSVQDRVKSIDKLLKPAVENLMLEVSRDVKRKIHHLEKEYRGKVDQAIAPLVATVVGELNIDGGLFARLPYWAAWAGDLALTIFITPFGPVTDLILRWLANYIPMVKQVLPIVIVRNHLVKNVADSTNQQFHEMKTQIQRQLNEHYCGAEAKLKQGWEENFKELLAPITGPLERELAGRDPQRQAKVTAAAREIRRLLATLD